MVSLSTVEWHIALAFIILPYIILDEILSGKSQHSGVARITRVHIRSDMPCGKFKYKGIIAAIHGHKCWQKESKRGRGKGLVVTIDNKYTLMHASILYLTPS